MSGIAQGLSGRSILQGLRDAGLGVRTQDFYRIVGVARSYFASAPETAALDQGGMVSSVAVERPSTLSGSYISTVALTVRNLDTGTYEPRFVTVTSLDDLSRGEVERAAMDAYQSSDKYTGDYAVAGASLVGVWLGA